jgi:hypothetical protein
VVLCNMLCPIIFMDVPLHAFRYLYHFQFSAAPGSPAAQLFNYCHKGGVVTLDFKVIERLPCVPPQFKVQLLSSDAQSEPAEAGIDDYLHAVAPHMAEMMKQVNMASGTFMKKARTPTAVNAKEVNPWCWSISISFNDACVQHPACFVQQPELCVITAGVVDRCTPHLHGGSACGDLPEAGAEGWLIKCPGSHGAADVLRYKVHSLPLM